MITSTRRGRGGAYSGKSQLILLRRGRGRGRGGTNAERRNKGDRKVMKLHQKQQKLRSGHQRRDNTQ